MGETANAQLRVKEWTFLRGKLFRLTSNDLLARRLSLPRCLPTDNVTEQKATNFELTFCPDKDDMLFWVLVSLHKNTLTSILSHYLHDQIDAGKNRTRARFSLTEKDFKEKLFLPRVQ